MTVHLISDAIQVQVDLVDENLIKALESLLDQAKRGQVISVCAVLEYFDDDPDFLISGVDDPYRTSGLLNELARYVGEDD